MSSSVLGTRKQCLTDPFMSTESHWQLWREEREQGDGFLLGRKASIDDVTDLIESSHDLDDRSFVFGFVVDLQWPDRPLRGVSRHVSPPNERGLPLRLSAGDITSL